MSATGHGRRALWGLRTHYGDLSPHFCLNLPQEVSCASQGSLTQFLVKPAVSCVEERALRKMFQTPAATVLPPLYITFHSQSITALQVQLCFICTEGMSYLPERCSGSYCDVGGEIPCKGKDFSLLYLPLDVHI